jgi:hypothetical protein
LSWDWSQTVILLPVACRVVGITSTCHHTWRIDWDGISWTFLASKHNPLDLCLLSNWDYRCEPPCPALPRVCSYNVGFILCVWKNVGWHTSTSVGS